MDFLRHIFHLRLQILRQVSEVDLIPESTGNPIKESETLGPPGDKNSADGIRVRLDDIAISTHVTHKMSVSIHVHTHTSTHSYTDTHPHTIH